MKKVAAVLLIMAMLVTMFTGCGAKKDSGDKSGSANKTERTFILGLDDSFPPMGFKDEDQNIVGFDIDLAKEVCKRLNYELKIQPISWKAKEQELNTKNIESVYSYLIDRIAAGSDYMYGQNVET